jgi:hypothetical protein
MRFPPVLMLRFFMMSAVLFFSGCVRSGKPEIARQSIELADRLTPNSLASVTDVPSKSQHIYIDSSWSMKGFISKGKPGGRTAFDEFIDVMPDVLPGCEVYRYGQAGQENAPVNNLNQIVVKTEFDAKLHDPTTYQLTYNPDDALLRHLVSQQEPGLSLLLTDGVESDRNGQVNTVVVDSIRSWMAQGKIFAILVMRSRFSGKFYSERQRKMLEGEVTVEDRPFYAFVLATSKREFDDLTEKLRRRFNDMQVISFSDDTISCRVELPAETNASYANEAPPGKPYYWQMLTAKDVQSPPDAPLVYKFIYEINAAYPIKSLGIHFRSMLYRWDSTRKQFEQEASPFADNLNAAAGEEADAQAHRVQSFSLPAGPFLQAGISEDYDFYSIEPTIYVKEVADDVGALSARDDSTQATANKTYRFQELVLALVDVHLKDRLLPRVSSFLYLTIDRT